MLKYDMYVHVFRIQKLRVSNYTKGPFGRRIIGNVVFVKQSNLNKEKYEYKRGKKRANNGQRCSAAVIHS
jgi:hypothetical protein